MVGFGTGLDSQFGMVDEVTWGTYLAPTRFLEFDSETIKAVPKQILSRGLGRARTQRGAQARTFITGAAGDTVHDVMTAGFGLTFKHMLGAVATTGVADPYTHTFTPDTVGLKGLSAVVQIGRPAISGTVEPFSYTGGKITKVKLAAALDAALKATISWDFQTEDTTQLLAAKAYAAGGVPLAFVDGSLTIGGVTQFIKAAELDIETGLDVARRGLGNVKKEQLANNELKISGSFDFELEDLVRHGDLVAGTLVTTVALNFANGTHALNITIPQMVYSPGGEPMVAGMGVVQEKMPWQATDDGTDPIITIAYVTSDATP
ncbi:MAG TPA: phage tail tube protein [Thermomicrobiaceae bacterium]|nr:phage tail tube protein [Thermomicrobiaceae bacterium]